MDEGDAIEIIPDEENSPIAQDDEIKIFWNQEMTFSLINEYRNHLQDFLYPQGRMIRDIWKNISENMQARGYSISAAACDRKWRQLKKTFKYNMPIGGRKARTRWVYYKALEDILGNKNITKRISWKQRSTIKQAPEEPNSAINFTQEDERLEDKIVPETENKSTQVKREEPPKWFLDFLTQYQEEENQKRKMLQKMHTDLVALERQKCILLENLIKKIPKTETIPKIVDAISLSQEMFEDEL